MTKLEPTLSTGCLGQVYDLVILKYFSVRHRGVYIKFQWPTTCCRRRPLVEDDLRWKTTFSGKRPSLEDNFDGRRPLVEDSRRWKTTFGGRQPSVEDDDFLWKMTFDGRSQWRKITFGGR